MNSFIDLLKNSGGYFEGHTVFKNGYHGDGWIEKGFIIRRPNVLDQVASLQADEVKKTFPDLELIVGPIVNGSIIASFVAKHLGCEFAITVGKEQEIEFQRMNIPKPSRKVVLIEDIIFTGVDIKANISFLKSDGFDVLGSVVWINRQVDSDFGVKVISLIEQSPFKFYSKSDCPFCKSNIPVKYENIRE